MEQLNREPRPERIVGIESLDQEGRGVGHWQGKTIFVDGALPGETVEFSPYRSKPAYAFAQTSAVLRSSAQRVTPRCPHFGVCGGCSVQHFDVRAQVAAKQRILEDALWHIGRVRPETMLGPIYGPSWEYRHRARLSVRNVPKKGGILIGFHERRRSYVADMRSCAVLPDRISRLLPELRALVSELSVRDRLPQIEVACAEAMDALVFRILRPLTGSDEDLVRRFADRHRVAVYLQSGGPESARLFHPSDAAEPSYALPEFGVTLRFSPTQFTQVNPAINRALVGRAIRLLAPVQGERIADMFCGVGNFSLAMASRGVDVIGFEGVDALVERARDNAAHNSLGVRCRFHRVDLFKLDARELSSYGRFDRMLIDPPRDGAIDLVKALAEQALPKRIVYVSCNPATLARDAAVLTQVKHYRLSAAGVVNMFPHTTHIESIAAFEQA